MNPDSLRKVLAESGPTSSAHVRDYVAHLNKLREAGYAAADAWQADLDRGAVACPELREDNNRFRKDNAALREQADVDRSFIEQYQR